jgi:hypothetical protein
VHGRLVDQVAVLSLTVIAEPLAVVGDDRHRDRTRRVPLEGLSQFPQLFVHRGHLTKIRCRAVGASKGLGRRVRRVRIEVVDPEEQRLLCTACEERDGTIGCLSGGTLRPPDGQLVVVGIESTRQPEPPGQDERRHKGGGSVPGRLQTFGKHRMCGREITGVLVHAVAGRVESGHHRAVRRECLGHGCVRLSEPLPSRGEGVECRRLDGKQCVRADRIRSRRVERHEKNRWARGRAWLRRRTFGPSAGRGRPQQRQTDGGQCNASDRRARAAGSHQLNGRKGQWRFPFHEL